MTVRAGLDLRDVAAKALALFSRGQIGVKIGLIPPGAVPRNQAFGSGSVGFTYGHLIMRGSNVATVKPLSSGFQAF